MTAFEMLCRTWKFAVISRLYSLEGGVMVYVVTPLGSAEASLAVTVIGSLTPGARLGACAMPASTNLTTVT